MKPFYFLVLLGIAFFIVFGCLVQRSLYRAAIVDSVRREGVILSRSGMSVSFERTYSGREYQKLVARPNEIGGVPDVYVLDEAMIDDDALLEICKLHRVRSLSVHSDLVTSRGLNGIRSLDSLKHLGLCGKKIGDDCVDTILSIKGLEHLDVCDLSSITETGRNRLDAGRASLSGTAK